MYFIPEIELISISHFGSFLETYSLLAENFIYICYTNINFNDISESLNSTKLKLNPGHISARHVLSPIEFKLSLIVYS